MRYFDWGEKYCRTEGGRLPTFSSIIQVDEFLAYRFTLFKITTSKNKIKDFFRLENHYNADVMIGAFRNPNYDWVDHTLWFDNWKTGQPSVSYNHAHGLGPSFPSNENKFVSHSHTAYYPIICQKRGRDL